MCIAFLYINPDPSARYRLVILNNRDEFFERPTEELQWIDGILAGIDQRDPAKGTWMGVDEQGRVGILLAITQPAQTKSTVAPSRGAIPKEFLKSSLSAPEFMKQLQQKAGEYNGFQFLALEPNSNGAYDLYSLTNKFVDKLETIKWPTGHYCMSNSPTHVPYKKTQHGEKRMGDLVQKLNDDSTIEEWIEGLLDIGTDKTNFGSDPQISLQTGQIEEYNKYLSSIFVRFPQEFIRYGTRSHSVFIVERDGNATFYEKRIVNAPEDINEAEWAEKTVKFKLSDNANKL